MDAGVPFASSSIPKAYYLGVVCNYTLLFTTQLISFSRSFGLLLHPDKIQKG